MNRKTFLASALVAQSFFLSVAPTYAHPGHPHFPGVSEHLSFELPSEPGMALVIALLGLCLGASFIELALVLFRLLQESRAKLLRLLGVIASLFLLSACGGGGGGGGGVSSKRPSAPAVRILHGGLDVEPIRLNSPSQKTGSSHFAEDSTTYVSFPEGPQNLVLERDNQPGFVVGTVSAEVDGGSFYSVLLSGEINQKTFRTSLIQEPDDRADSGKARVQLVHALSGVGSLVISGAGFTLGPVDFRGSSGFVELPSGPQTFALASSDGRAFGTVTANLGDRGQTTVLITGSAKDGVVVKKVYNDLG